MFREASLTDKRAAKADGKEQAVPRRIGVPQPATAGALWTIYTHAYAHAYRRTYEHARARAGLHTRSSAVLAGSSMRPIRSHVYMHAYALVYAQIYVQAPCMNTVLSIYVTCNRTYTRTLRTCMHGWV